MSAWWFNQSRNKHRFETDGLRKTTKKKLVIIFTLISFAMFSYLFIKNFGYSQNQIVIKYKASVVHDEQHFNEEGFFKNANSEPKEGVYVKGHQRESFLNSHKNPGVSCFEENSNGEGFLNLHETPDHQVSPLRKNIFFLETCCGESMVLNPRQACSIESAAKNNPDRDVHLFVINPKKVSNESTQLIHQLLTYPNIQISRIKADDYMKDTPLEQWYAHKPMKTSQWPNVHLSDVLRLITLWKYPGIYLDLDVVVMKSFDALESNFAGAQSSDTINNNVLGFSNDTLGRKLATDCLLDVKKNYNGQEWSQNGPSLMTRVLNDICTTSTPVEMKPDRCQGFMVYDPSVFNPIPYEKWTEYFEERYTKATMRIIQNSFLVHLWGRMSGLEPLRVSSEVAYTILARTHCPKVFENCGDSF